MRAVDFNFIDFFLLRGLLLLQRKWAVVKWPFRFNFMADSMIWHTRKGSPRKCWFKWRWWPSNPLSFFRSILIQFESNCKSITLVAMTCVSFFYDTTIWMATTNQFHPMTSLNCSSPCLLTFHFAIVGTFMFIALDKHKFPSNKIHMKVVLLFFSDNLRTRQKKTTPEPL